MKKIFSTILAITTLAFSAIALSSCSEKHECFFCEEENKCVEKDFWDETIYVCEDCMEEFGSFDD